PVVRSIPALQVLHPAGGSPATSRSGFLPGTGRHSTKDGSRPAKGHGRFVSSRKQPGRPFAAVIRATPLPQVGRSPSGPPCATRRPTIPFRGDSFTRAAGAGRRVATVPGELPDFFRTGSLPAACRAKSGSGR